MLGIPINSNPPSGVGYPQNQNSINQSPDEQTVAAFEANLNARPPETVSNAAPAATGVITFASLSPEQQQTIAAAIKAAPNLLPGTLSNATQAATDVKPFVLSPEQQQLIEKSLAEIIAAQNLLPGTLSNATQVATDVKPFVLSPEQQQQLNEYSNTMKKHLGITQ
jgi:hypothetical protein